MNYRQAILNCGTDAHHVATTTHRGTVQVYWNPGKSYASVHVKEAGRARVSRRVLKGTPEHARLRAAVWPLYHGEPAE